MNTTIFVTETKAFIENNLEEINFNVDVDGLYAQISFGCVNADINIKTVINTEVQLYTSVLIFNVTEDQSQLLLKRGFNKIRDNIIQKGCENVTELQKAIKIVIKSCFIGICSLESGLSSEQAILEFRKYPSFFVREDEGTMIMYDTITHHRFWKTTSIREVKRFANGYWYVKTDNTKYNFCVIK